VLDTWFSSALWPFSTLGWPDRTPELARFYPTSVLVTGFDIIFFWVARMIMMGLKFMDEVPFREVYVHGLIRDHEGQKMSKSKGNVIDPLDIVDGIELETLVAKRTTGLMQPHLAAAIEKATRKQFPAGIAAHGTDALRFTFAAMATQSRDLRFDLGRVEGYRNFCNKLWNASRYVLMATEQDEGAGPEELSLADRWIRARLDVATRAVHEGFASYRLDLAAQAAYEFTWYEFCDWYLELSKAGAAVAGRPARPRAAARAGRWLGTLEALLRLLHPLMPFITEEIWLPRRRRAPASVRRYHHARALPRSRPSRPWTRPYEDEMRWVMDFILGVRQIRGEMDIAPSLRFEVLLQDAGAAGPRAHGGATPAYLGAARERQQGQAACGSAPGRRPRPRPSALLGGMKILVPMAGLIDVAAETARLGKRRAKLEQELGQGPGQARQREASSRTPRPRSSSRSSEPGRPVQA
jgi:valyl-tRNA synthetase